MDLNEFYGLLQEYTLDNENYKGWREIHGKAFGKAFLSAFNDSPEAQIHLTAALIKISNRDYKGGLALLLMLEDLCFNDFDDFALSYFIGFCYELLEDEEQMAAYYEKMSNLKEDYTFKIAFHPYYRTAKFAQRKAENEKALSYYNKALAVYCENETDVAKNENIGQIYYDMGTVCLSAKNYEEAWRFLKKSCEVSPGDNPQRNYVMAVLFAVEGKTTEAQKLVERLPDYLKSNCEYVIASL